MKRIIGILTVIFTCAFAAHAAFACDAGYYLDGNECTACQTNHYCPGDDQIYDCPAFTYNNLEEDVYPMVTGYNVHSIESAKLWSSMAYNDYDMVDIEHCVVVLSNVEVDEGNIMRYLYRYSPTSNAYTFWTGWWSEANAGYYLSPAISWTASEVWYGAKQCTNSHPANSHYSGPGTPDSKDGTVVDANDCPWECDAGYYNNNGTCTACPTGYTSNAGATAENQCFITVAGGHYIGTAGQNNTNWETCAAGYARAEHTVNYGSTSSCTACTGATYTDTAGASSCTACPTATTYASRVTSYWYYSPDNVHNTVNRCRAYITENDPTGDYTLSCSYANSDYGIGGSTGTDCMATNVTSCAAQKYAPYSNPTVNVSWAPSVTAMEGSVCVAVGNGYYSPDGALTRTACTNAPANATYTGSAADNTCPWTCDAGYYLDNNNQCAPCNTSAAYYCPGDNTKHDCPTIDDNFYQWAYDTYGITQSPGLIQKYWTSASSLRTSIEDCVAYHEMSSDTALRIYFSVKYNTTFNLYRSGTYNLLYRTARPGYYLKQPKNSNNNYFQQITACTNAPANAHYTGAGTNDTYDGTVVDANDCPWECDSGYGQTIGGQCSALCGAGVTELHVGNLYFNVYANKNTTPALNINYNNTICYVSLATGSGTNALHIQAANGTVYHTVN